MRWQMCIFNCKRKLEEITKGTPFAGIKMCAEKTVPNVTIHHYMREKRNVEYITRILLCITFLQSRKKNNIEMFTFTTNRGNVCNTGRKIRIIFHILVDGNQELEQAYL